MNNFDHAIQATETAMNSAGSATQENERALESLASKTNNLRATFEDLANNVINNQLVKTVLDLANAFLKLLNTPVGTFATQVGLITGVLWGGTGLIQAMKVLPAMFSKLAEGVTIAGTATKIAFPHILAISAAIAGIVAIAPKVIDWFKDITNDVEYASEKSQEYSTKLEENKTKLESLSKIPVQYRTEETQKEIDALVEENKQLQENIDKWNEKAKAGKIKDLTKGTANVARQEIRKTDTGELLGIAADDADEAIEKLKELGYVANDAKSNIEELGFELIDVARSVSKEDYYQGLIQRQQELNAQFKETGTITPDLISEYQEVTGKLQELSEVSSDISDSDLPEWVIEVRDSFKETPNVIDQMTESIYDADDSLAMLIGGLTVNETQINQLLKKYPQLTSLIQQNADGYYIEASALGEVTRAGGVWASSVNASQKEATLTVLRESAKRLKAMITEAQGMGKAYDPKAFQALLDSYKAIGGQIRSLSYGLGSVEVISPIVQEKTGRVTKSSTKKETDPLKEQSDIYKELNEATEHNISLKEKQGAEVATLIQLYRDYQNQLHAQANWFREQGEGEDSAYIRELQNKWYEVENNITKLNQDQFNKRLQILKDYIDDRNKYADWGADSEIAAWKRVLDWMENEYYKKGLVSYETYAEKRKEITENLYEAERKAIEDAYDKQISNLEKKQKAYEALFSFVTDKINDKLEELNQKRQDIIDDYDKEIEALQKQNEEIERQIELEQLQANLAKANQKKVMVYKDGKFQYMQDIDEISDAQLALEKYEREEALRQEVANLEAAKEKALQIIDEQIKNWEKYKKEWSEVVDNYQKEQDRLLVLEELGIELEGNLWEERLDNLDQYANEYKEILQSIIDAQKAANDALEALQAQQSQGMLGPSGNNFGGGGGGTVTPGKGAPGKGFNAWAKIDGVGFVPVTVVDGKTQQTDLPAGTIVYGDEGAWQITGGKGGKDGYTSEYIGKTPSDIWTPSKGYGSSSSSGGGSGGGGGSSNKKPSSNRVDDIDKQMASNSEKWHSASAEEKKELEQANKDLAAERDKITGGSSKFDSTTGKWTKNARGTVSARGGISLVGEKGAELRVLNRGDGIIPANVTKNLWSWGMTTPADMVSTLSGFTTNNSGTNITIENFAPNLPSVSNGEDFARYIRQDFIREVMQFSVRR